MKTETKNARARKSSDDVQVMSKDPLHEFVRRLNRDEAAASKLLDREQLQFFCRMYDSIQADRVALGNAAKAFARDEKPNTLILFFEEQTATMERQLQNIVRRYVYSSDHPAMKWMRGIYGVGPVIAASFFAFIDIRKATSPSHIESYCGLNPNMVWNKGQKRPFNDHMKKICYYLGESIVKTKTRIPPPEGKKSGTFYGMIYDDRMEYEKRNNEAGLLADQALKYANTKYKNTESVEVRRALAEGKLPQHALDRRAKRKAVKMFICHMWHIWREAEGLPLLDPYIIAHGQHSDYIPPPPVEKVEASGD